MAACAVSSCCYLQTLFLFKVKKGISEIKQNINFQKVRDDEINHHPADHLQEKRYNKRQPDQSYPKNHYAHNSGDHNERKDIHNLLKITVIDQPPVRIGIDHRSNH